MTDLSVTLPESVIVGFLESSDECVAEIDLLVDIGVYSRKDHAVAALKRNFTEGLDYSRVSGKTPHGGRPSASYLLTSDCFKQMCMMAETEFGRAVRKYYLEVERRWKESRKASQAPYFYQRLQTFSEKTGRIKPGYFCIFQEITPLVRDLESYGYILPENAVIDSSIGRRFCDYLRDECSIDPDEVCETYKHYYPGRRWAVDARLYPLSLIGVFREWLEYQYYHEYLIPYFKGRRDPEALQAVSRFLGLLPSQ
jgi:phage anti-repressor protein